MITRGHAYKLRKIIESLSISLDDETALTVVELFPEWNSNSYEYKINDRIKYMNILYKCIQSHTSQSDWAPDMTPALWIRISIEEWPEWIQPLGAQDAYMIGDKVSHNESHWISIVDNNVWEPGVYGWEQE